MYTRHVDGVTIRPLRNGDTATVLALFERLGPQSRAQRFGGAKPRLAHSELELLARVDRNHHVLVGYVKGDSQPAGIGRLARNGSTAEIAFAVSDQHQGRGIGTVLMRELAADARAAGITEFHATIAGDNVPAVSLLRRWSQILRVSWQGEEREFVLGL